jgi:hypothetical protein
MFSVKETRTVIELGRLTMKPEIRICTFWFFVFKVGPPASQAYMCGRFSSGGGGCAISGEEGVKFVDPIFNGQFFSKKKKKNLILLNKNK